MIALAERAGQILVLILMAALAYLYVDGLQARLAKAEDDVRIERQAVADRDGTILQLRELDHRKEVAAAELEGERNGIQQGLNTRQIEMRKLQDENAEIRAWAAVAVPADVVRLREHGPLTGAAAYRQFLSQGSALQPARRAGEE
jgi:LysB family phage lysis regulatory protein